MAQYFIKYANQASVNHKSSSCLLNFILHRNGAKLVLIKCNAFFSYKVTSWVETQSLESSNQTGFGTGAETEIGRAWLMGFWWWGQ